MSQQLPEAATALLETPLTPDSIEAVPVPDWYREELKRRREKANAEI